MQLADGIQSLRRLHERLSHEGHAAAADLVQQVRACEWDARDAAMERLADLCRAAADSIEAVARTTEQFVVASDAVDSHVGSLIAYAERCLEAVAAGKPADAEPAPEPLRLADAEEERHYAETVGLFVSQTVGALAELEEELLAIEAAADPSEQIAAVRRTVHTMKAEFGVLGMVGPQALCHQAESAIDACTEHGARFPVDAMLALVDNLKQFAERLTKDVRASFGDAEPILVRLSEITAAAQSAGAMDARAVVQLEVGGDFADNLPEFIVEARGHLTDAENALVELEGHPGDAETLNRTFRAFHTIKGVAGFLNLAPLVELAHVAETLLDGARSGRFACAAADIDLVLSAGDMITAMINALEGGTPPLVRDWKSLIDALRARGSRSGVACAAPAVSEQPQPNVLPTGNPGPAAAAVPTAAAPASSPRASGPQREPEADDRGAVGDGSVLRPQAPSAEGKAARVDRTIKVSTARLDMLVDMVGELVIAQSMVLQDPAIQRLESQSLTRNIGQVGKITRDLQEAAMSLRMVTVKATFQKMARLVRDVATKSKKRVTLTITGEDTELDRNVVEQISDPLVHMIRNAIDHGIEDAETRRQNGKSPEGHVHLSAYHQGGSIVIEIRDDGRGVDRHRVFKKAVEKGLLPADTVESQLSDAEAFGLIFLPGFSTAETVTDLSGRGVGMDVVRRNIEALRGKVEIVSTLGQGSTFRLRLPLTLAIIDGMIVRVGTTRYVLPTLSIEQSFRPRREDVHHLVDRDECVSVRGAVLPVHRLKRLFALRDGLEDITEGILIVVEANGERSCLFVDEILGQQQVVIKAIGLSRERTAGLSGGAIMTDGRVALILDIGTLIDSVRAEAGAMQR
jgi:two-component system, chemotaxis family, sensor kinase CheA